MYICAQLECLIFQLWQLEKCIWSSGIVVTDGCETLCSFWELKEPLEGQLILLTSKSLHQNQKWSLKSCQCEIQALCPLLPLPLGTVFLIHFSLTSASITYIGTKTVNFQEPAPPELWLHYFTLLGIICCSYYKDSL